METPVKKVICQYCFYTWIILGLAGCSSVETKPITTTKVKNVILVIGDGMGPQQLGLLLSYARQAPNGVLKQRTTSLDRMMNEGRLGISLTYPNNALVVDSAASATQLATGKFAGSEMIGVDKNGNKQETIIDKAKRLGKATGLISDTRITHATPAAFAAHETHRSLENNIAEDLLTTHADVMLSGGLNSWIPKQANDKNSSIYKQVSALTDNAYPFTSTRKDDKNLLTTAQQQGYTLVFNKQQLLGSGSKTLGLFANSLMANGIVETEERAKPEHTQPTLKEMTEKALSILDSNNEGFFLMVEAGQIDMAAHRNDTGLMLHEMLKFDETLNTILDWAKGRQDTLVVVTADHETGGFGFSYSGVNIPKPRQLSGDAFGHGMLFKPDFNFGNPEVLDKLYAQRLSYEDIFKQFDALPKAQQTALTLVELVNRYTEFKISEQQAKKILATEDNPLYQAGHQYLGLKTVPKMDVNGEFFPYQKDNRQNLLARAVASSQQVVWATGTHTSTPVYVFVTGTDQSMQPFTKILHHTLLGQLLYDALR